MITDEIDVFADISTKQQLDTLPPVFEMPVAPAMRSYMDVDLAVTAEGPYTSSSMIKSTNIRNMQSIASTTQFSTL